MCRIRSLSKKYRIIKSFYNSELTLFPKQVLFLGDFKKAVANNGSAYFENFG